jgi:hypothetical protein
MSAEKYFSEERIKHLEMIQAVVARLAKEAALIRGWSLTVAAGFYAYSAEAASWPVAVVGMFAILVFWVLNAYYLHTERRFRCLFNRARSERDNVPLFSMDAGCENPGAPAKTLVSLTLLLFYGLLLVVGFVLAIVGFY